MAILDQLRRAKWFLRCTAPVQEALASAGRVVALEAGQWVYGEGDETTGIAIVLDGMLRLEAAVGPRTVLVGVARAGDTIGQSQRRGGGPRIVTARASRASHVVTVSDMALERIGGEHPALWRSVSELVYAQLDASVHGLAQMLALQPRARIVARLLAFADNGEVPLTQTDLAELCGMSRKAVSAHLGAWERSGAITRAYGRVRLIDTVALARLLR